MSSSIPPVAFLTTLPLKHNGDCSLLGVTPDLTIFAEEMYGEEGWLAQHALLLDGTLTQSVDEFSGAADEVQPLDLPAEIIRSKTAWHTMALNFAGPRHRGLRGLERVLDLVRPLSIQEKTALILRFQLDLLPPQLLGVAESYVLAETQITQTHPILYFVCRRVRLAVALPEEQLDEDSQPYDYDTFVLYLAHFYERDQEPAFGDIIGDLTTVPLFRPMDCLLLNHHLFIADGGSDDRLSAIHVWQIDVPEENMTEAEKLHKKIYG